MGSVHSLTMLLSSCGSNFYPDITGKLYYDSSTGKVNYIKFTVTGGGGGPYNVYYLLSASPKKQGTDGWTYIGKAYEGEEFTYYVPGNHYISSGWYYNISAVDPDGFNGYGYAYWH